MQEEGVEEHAGSTGAALNQDPLVLHLQAVDRCFEAVHLEAAVVEMVHLEAAAVAAGSAQILKACPPPCLEDAGRFVDHLYHLCQRLVVHRLAVDNSACN